MLNVFYRFQTSRSYFQKQQLFYDDKCIYSTRTWEKVSELGQIFAY